MPTASRSRRRNQTVLTAAALAGLGLLPNVSRAADIHWDVADGNWDTATNWVGGVVPGNLDRGIVDRAGGGTTHVTTDTVDVKGVSVANGNVLSVETGGNLTTVTNVPDDVAADGIHIADGGAGSASVTDNGVLATTGGGYQGTITVGRGGATGSLTVDGATALVDGNDIHIGGTSLPQNGGPSPGTGTVDLRNGTLNARAWSFVGRDGGTGTVNQSGGSFHSAGQLHVGFAGGTGNYNLSGGQVSSGNDVAIGNGGGASGTVTQTGGTFHNQGGWAFIGRTGATGLYNISAGEFIVNGNLNVGFEPGGVGRLLQTGGTVTGRENLHVGRGGGTGTYDLMAGTLNVGVSGGPDPDLIVGADGGTTGVMNQTGGEVKVARWGFVGRNNGNGTFNQSAGTYSSNGWMRVAEAPGSVGAYNLSGTAIANIGGGDADTGDDDVILGIDPLSSGTLDIRDTAVLNAARDIRLGLEGGNGTYVQSGSADVNVAGAVFVGNNQSASTVPASGLFTVNGGTLDVAIDMNVGEGTNTSGQVTIAGGATTVNGALRVGNNGAGIVDQSAGAVTAGSLVVSANPTAVTPSTGDYNLTGGTLTALSTTNNGTLDISGNATASLGPVSGTGAMTVAGTATVAADHVRQPSLAMTGGTVRINDTGNGAGAGVSNLADYSLTGDARFDLRDNKLVTGKAAGTFTAGAYTGVQGDVAKAYNFGAWDMPGLTTSEDLAGPNAGPLSGTTTIGVATGEQILFIAPTDTGTFAGQTITGATTIAMYTYAGDVNFDGLVDAADYGVIDNFVQFPGTDGYANGDLNFDGVIDAGDYGIIDNTIQLQGAPFLGVNDTFASGSAAAALSGVTAVPEPAAFSLALVAAAGLLGRRRRTK